MWTVPPQPGNILVAQIGRLEEALVLVLPVALLLAAFGVGVWVCLWVKRWSEDLNQDPPASRRDLLDQYQEMVEAGVLAPEEFARIKASMEPRPPETGIQEGLPPNQPKPETGIQAGFPPDGAEPPPSQPTDSSSPRE